MISKHILLIDDEEYLSLVIQTCLIKLGGWRVSIANSGQDGLRIAEAEMPDAILLDMMMPDMDGRKVLHCLRENPQTEAIPVIVLTAHPVAQTEQAALRVIGILAKPFEPLQLVPKISTLLNWNHQPQ
ncbi:MAG: response regulator [Leptolyngbya sp. Prado105]|nr:response regulator [Leptolyngbya sp. Prado105]